MLILRQENHKSVTQEKIIAQTGSSTTHKEQDNILPDHSSYSFPMKFGQNFQKLYW